MVDQQRSRRRTGRGVALATCLLLLLAACAGAEDEPEEGPANGGTGSGDGDTTVDDRPYDPDAVLRFNYSTGPAEGFDPDRVANPVFLTWLYPIYDTLVYLTPAGDIEPMLARSWEFNDDGILLELTEGWAFHDGAPFDAAAVVANLERSKSVDGSTTAGELESVTDVEAVSESVVQLHVDGSPAPVLSSLASNAGMMVSPAEFDRADFDINPQGGSGQFQLVDFQLDQYTEYEAVDGYWDPDVADTLGGLVIPVTSDDSARLNSVLDGTNQMAFLRPEQVEQAESEGLTVIADRPSLLLYFLGLNTSRGPLADVKVRQALEHAIDRDVIANDLLEGLCIPSTQLFPSFFWAHNDDIPDVAYPYDLAHARDLLEEAGYADGFELAAAVNDGQVYVDIATVIQAQLREVGVDMSIDPMSPDATREAFEIAQSHDVQVNQINLASEPSSVVSQFFLADGARNPGGYEADGVAALHTDGLTGIDQSDREAPYAEIMQSTVADVYPNINLCHLISPYVHDGSVQNLELSADGVRRLRGVTVAQQD